MKKYSGYAVSSTHGKAQRLQKVIIVHHEAVAAARFNVQKSRCTCCVTGDVAVFRQREAAAQAELVSCRRQLAELREEYAFMASQLAESSRTIPHPVFLYHDCKKINVLVWLQVLADQTAQKACKPRYDLHLRVCTVVGLPSFSLNGACNLVYCFVVTVGTHQGST